MGGEINYYYLLKMYVVRALRGWCAVVK